MAIPVVPPGSNPLSVNTGEITLRFDTFEGEANYANGPIGHFIIKDTSSGTTRYLFSFQETCESSYKQSLEPTSSTCTKTIQVALLDADGNYLSDIPEYSFGLRIKYYD